jgi:uncharacterized membrane protein YhfC
LRAIAIRAPTPPAKLVTLAASTSHQLRTITIAIVVVALIIGAIVWLKTRDHTP